MIRLTEAVILPSSVWEDMDGGEITQSNIRQHLLDMSYKDLAVVAYQSYQQATENKVKVTPLLESKWLGELSELPDNHLKVLKERNDQLTSDSTNFDKFDQSFIHQGTLVITPLDKTLNTHENLLRNIQHITGLMEDKHFGFIQAVYLHYKTAFMLALSE